MRSRLKRLVGGAAACAIAAGTVSILASATPAFALGVSGGAATILSGGGSATPLNSGNSNTPFHFGLPNGAACTGDGIAGYRVNSYMVPVGINPNTITFDSNGPVPVAGEFRSTFYDLGQSPYVQIQPANAVPAGGPGPIIQPITDFNFAVFSPAGFPLTPGVYNVGIACTIGAPGPTQEDKYFNTVMTLTANAADPGPAKVTWVSGAVPSAPVLNTVTPNNGTLTANYTATAATPAATSYTATATPASGPAITGTSASPTATTISGLTNGVAYSVTVTQTSTAGTSAPSNAISATPAAAPHPPVQNLTATPGVGKVDLSWTAPADAGTTAPTGYTVTNSPAGGTTTITGTTASVTGLTAGTPYTFTVTATYATAPAGTPAVTSPVAPTASQVLMQNLTVTRPVGALVFTQVCGRNGAIAADTTATIGFPSGSLPAVAASLPAADVAPTFSGAPDPKFSEYPYPQNPDGTPAPNYPTNCGVALGNAKFVASGPGAGQFFAASGVLNQVSVADTRDTDIGWTANGAMGAFTSGPGKTFSGSQLGWTPVRTSDTGAFTDSDGITYDQVTNPGAVVLANTLNATGLSSGRALGTAAALAGTTPNFTGGLGIAAFDARLKLLIPVTKKSGIYTGVLTISAV